MSAKVLLNKLPNKQLYRSLIWWRNLDITHGRNECKLRWRPRFDEWNIS